MKKKRSFAVSSVITLIAIVIFAAVLAFINKGGFMPERKDPDGKRCEVTVLSVGDALCCYASDGERSIMIDLGSWQTRDTVEAFIKNKGTDRLDLLVITHPHADHYGGYTALKGVSVDKVYISEADDDTLYYHDVLDFFRDKGADVAYAPVGETMTVGDMILSFLGPLQADEDLNDMSVVIRLSYENHSVFFCSDMTGDEADSIMDRGAVLSSDVYVAAHHGSSADGANSYRLLREVMPSYAIIPTAGSHSSHGYPHEAFISRLEDLDCDYYRTDLFGDITFVIDSTGIKFR